MGNRKLVTLRRVQVIWYEILIHVSKSVPAHSLCISWIIVWHKERSFTEFNKKSIILTKVCFNKIWELMVFTYHGHHNKSFSSSNVMKQTRCSLPKNNSVLGEVMRYCTSASKTGVLSLQGRLSLVCVLRVGVWVLRTIIWCGAEQRASQSD